MLTSQQANPQGSDLFMLPGGGSGNRNPNIRTSERKSCVKCETEHPRKRKLHRKDRRDENSRCQKMEHNFKEWLDKLLDEQ